MERNELRLKNINYVKIIKILVCLILISFLCLSLQRAWTGIPKGSISTKNVEPEHRNLYTLWNYLKQGTQFAYFTTLSNIIVVISITLAWLFGINIRSEVRGFIFTYIFISSLLFWTVLAPYAIWNQFWYYSFINAYEHTVPMFAAFFLLWEGTKIKNIKKRFAYLYIFPVVYLAFSIILFSIIGEKAVIYPFLNYGDIFNFGWSKITSYILSPFVILVLFAIFGLTYYLSIRFILNKNKK